MYTRCMPGAGMHQCFRVSLKWRRGSTRLIRNQIQTEQQKEKCNPRATPWPLHITKHKCMPCHRCNGWMVSQSRSLVSQKHNGWPKRAIPILNRGTRYSYTVFVFNPEEIPIQFTPNHHGGRSGGRFSNLVLRKISCVFAEIRTQGFRRCLR